jgi:hypothetical protein
VQSVDSGKTSSAKKHPHGRICLQILIFKISIIVSTLPMIWYVPAEAVLLDNVGQPGLVGEEEGQIRGQDAVLHVTQHLRTHSQH